MRNSVLKSARYGGACAAAVCLLSAAAAVPGFAAPGGAGAAPAAAVHAPVGEAARIPFAKRYAAVLHGGVVRAADSAISCQAVTRACTDARAGRRAAANENFDMLYADVDSDPNTYNSTRASLDVPAGARIAYARLYWGGNLRVGEQKPSADDGRVLVAEPGGSYKAVRADTLIGHRTGDGADAYQASADVTSLVRDSQAGMYTVAQLNVAKGRSAAGAWGGWTLVAVYEKADAPLRRVALWDGFESLGARRPDLSVDLPDFPVPAGGPARLGVVAYDGDRGARDSLAVRADDGRYAEVSDQTHPSDDVMNSGLTDGGVDRMKRQPAYANNLGYDSSVFDISGAVRAGGNHLGVRISAGRDSVWPGAFFVEVGARS